MAAITIVPANEASWDHIQAIFGEGRDAPRCRCQWYKATHADWRSMPVEERTARHREQAGCGTQGPTSGLVAYVDDEPAAWCAVEPRTEYVRMRTMRIPWSGRNETRDDPTVWAVTCFVTRPAFRRQGIGTALAAAAVEHARANGATAVEAYPMTTKDVTREELFVGTTTMFAKAGFTEVSRPSERRAVMRIEC